MKLQPDPEFFEPPSSDLLRDDERHAAIEKAKREWEITVDALTAMVFLINPEAMILRANRVVEHWGSRPGCATRWGN